MNVRKGFEQLLFIIISTVLLHCMWLLPVFASSSTMTEKYVQPYLGATTTFGKWNGAIPWVYNPTSAPALFSDSNKVVVLLQEAMAEWSGVSGIRFTYQGIDSTAADVIDGKVVVYWGNTGVFTAFAGPSYSNYSSDRTLGYHPYTDGKVVISPSYDWTHSGQLSAAMSENLLKKFLVHEVGHLIGLGHSDNPVSIMYANPYNNITHLMADDIAAAQAYYGPSLTPTTIPVYTPPTATNTIFTSSMLYLNSSGNTVAVSTLTDAVTDSDVLNLKLVYAGGFNKNIEIYVVDPFGYVIQEVARTVTCPASDAWCSMYSGIGFAVDTLKKVSGVYHVYVVSASQLVAHHTFTVATTIAWNRPPVATLALNATSGVAPFTVNATVTATDPELDQISISWHIPGAGTVSENVLLGSATRSMTFSTAGQYEVFVAVNDNGSRYTGAGTYYSPISSAGQGARLVLRQTVTVTGTSVPTTTTPVPTTSSFNINDFFPMEVGNYWTFKLKDNSIETVTITGTENINSKISTIWSSSDGNKDYWYSDSTGLYLTKESFDGNIATYSPPLKLTDSNVNIGSTYKNSGTTDLSIPGVGVAGLNYSSSVYISGFETVTVPVGTFYAAKIQITLQSFGIINGKSFDSTITENIWLVNGVGQIKSTDNSSVTFDGQTETNSESKELTSSNLAISHSISVSKTGSGTVTSTPAGITCGSDCTENYTTGMPVSFTATPASGFLFTGWGGNCSGTETCTVTMTAAKSVTATFTQINRAPTATNASISTNEDVIYTGTLAASDLDSNPLTYSIVTQPTKGTVTVTNIGTGAFSYTPNKNINGSDNFSFRVYDGTLYSNAASITVAVTPVNDLPTGSVTITGTANRGHTLTVTNTLADVDGMGTVSYQWKADGVAIAGATGSSLVLTESLVGKTISVVASYTDGHGTAESVTSSAGIAVANVNDLPTGGVTIVGTAIQGQTLTATSTLVDADGLGTISYQWKADGVAIAGATGNTFTLTEAQIGKTITVAVGYTDGHGTTESVPSSATNAIERGVSLAVELSGVTTGAEVQLSLWSKLTGSTGFEAMTYQTSVTGITLSSLSPASDYVLYIEMEIAGNYQSGFYAGPDKPLGGLMQAKRIDLSAGDKAITVAFNAGKTIAGVLSGLPASETAWVEAWSAHTFQGKVMELKTLVTHEFASEASIPKFNPTASPFS